MSNKTTLLAWVQAQTEEVCAAVCAAFNIVVPSESNHDAPDEHAAVKCLLLRASRPEANERGITQEIVNSLPPGAAKDFGNKWLGYINTLYMFNGFKTLAVHDDNGKFFTPGVFVAASVNLRDGSPVWPTVQDVTDGLNALPDPTTNQGQGFKP
jgi:hypothetical protein